MEGKTTNGKVRELLQKTTCLQNSKPLQVKWKKRITMIKLGNLTFQMDSNNNNNNEHERGHTKYIDLDSTPNRC